MEHHLIHFFVQFGHIHYVFGIQMLTDIEDTASLQPSNTSFISSLQLHPRLLPALRTYSHLTQSLVIFILHDNLAVCFQQTFWISDHKKLILLR